MSQTLARARDRFEATPRSLDDDELIRISRGDRGCLGDLLSGLGAVSMVGGIILGALGKLPFAVAYVGVAIWIGGFVWGTISQSRSGKQRKGALESGPLVLGVVLRSEEWLRRPGKRVGRAVALFSTDPRYRFDRDWLEQTAQSLERRLDEVSGTPDWVPLRALLADPDSFGVHRVPSELLVADPGSSEAPAVYLAAVVVHPDRLDAGYLGGDDDDDAGQRGVDIDTPMRPPTIVAIVAPERAFIEQVPHPNALPPKPSAAAADSDA